MTNGEWRKSRKKAIHKMAYLIYQIFSTRQTKIKSPEAKCLQKEPEWVPLHVIFELLAFVGFEKHYQRAKIGRSKSYAELFTRVADVTTKQDSYSNHKLDTSVSKSHPRGHKEISYISIGGFHIVSYLLWYRICGGVSYLRRYHIQWGANNTEETAESLFRCCLVVVYCSGKP